jgi:hypothetical protein
MEVQKEFGQQTHADQLDTDHEQGHAGKQRRPVADLAPREAYGS